MHLKRFRALIALPAALAASLPALAAYDVDLLTPASPMARDAYNLHWGIMWVCLGIFVVVFGAMFWSIFKHRKNAGAKAAQFHENTTIEVIWTIVPFVVLIGMAYPATRTMIEMKDASGADMSIKVTGYQWRWEYDYQNDGIKLISNLATPRDQIDDYDGASKAKNDHYLLEVDQPLVVPAGKKVRLLVTSGDVIHGWYVPQLGVNQYGIPGFIKDVWFEADKPGTYRGQCSQICGKEHGFMPIVVVAKTADDYAAWVKQEKAKMAAAAPAPAEAAPMQVAAAAAAPAEDLNKKWSLGELKESGAKVFAANCAACHQANGKGVPGAFPALDGSKVATGPKAAHIATVLKGRPGTAMASFLRLTDVELAEVITYERNAWGNKTGDAIQPSEIAAARKAL